MPSDRLSEGSLLGGRYEVLAAVGRGGMGTVYRALDTRIDTIVAVKELSERDATEEERAAAIQQFEREAKLLAQLRHPNLPRVTDYFVEGERCYLVMEFVTGETLEERINAANGQPQPLLQALDWGIQLADTLAYLHAQDPPIVFRDMKPANVMITTDGEVKLIDFGIARRFQSGAAKDTLLYGSPGYSPPEQYGRTQTDPRSDIYALGATLHHLVTGRDPAPAPFKFPSVRSLDKSLPAQLDALISRCLEMDIDKRIQNAAKVRDRLIAIRASLPATAAVGAGRRPGPQDRGLATHDSRLTSPDSPPHPFTPSSTHPSRGPRTAAVILSGLSVLLGAVAVFALATGRHAHSPHAVAPAPLPPVTQPVAQPSLGGLHVTSTPAGVAVWLDGEQRGVTPLDIPRVAAGQHALRLVPSDSAYGEWDKSVEVPGGETVPVDAQLPQAQPTAAPQSGAAAAVQAFRVLHVPATMSQPAGLQIHVAFRVTGAAGKSGQVAALFYGADRTTPLKARPDEAPYQNSDGQLSVSSSFEAQTDPQDFPDLTLSIPDAAFPNPYDQVTWRLIIYVDGQPAYESQVTALPRLGP